jgi:hypothetical protein
MRPAGAQLFHSDGQMDTHDGNNVCTHQWHTQKFFSGGVQQIQLTEGRENRDLGAVAPQSGDPPNLQVGETCIIITFLRCIFHGTGNSARLCQNFGINSGGFEPPNPPSGYASGTHGLAKSPKHKNCQRVEVFFKTKGSHIS